MIMPGGRWQCFLAIKVSLYLSTSGGAEYAHRIRMSTRRQFEPSLLRLRILRGRRAISWMLPWLLLLMFGFPSVVPLISAVRPPSQAETPGTPGVDHASLAASLQLWLRADRLALKDGAEVYRWPDQSIHRRDVSPTLGVFEGAGKPPSFVKSSHINGRPAVRFQKDCGLGSPGDLPVAINGDAAYTLIVVAQLKYQEGSSHDVIAGFGEFSNPTNVTPGRPGSGLLEIDRTPEGRHRLDHAGGFKRDALIGRPGSFASFYDQPLVLVLTKTPGSMRDTSTLHINGAVIDSIPASGSTALPDIRHRPDFSVILGHSHAVTGNLDGDIAEVLLYNVALSKEQRQAIERDLSRKYAISPEPEEEPPTPARLTEEQRNHWAFRNLAPLPAILPQPHSASPVSRIDQLLLQRLEERGLHFSAEADQSTLLRRAHLDLTGLPPSPEETTTYLASTAPDAYEKLIDDLLASPHFGERWGRHWLDLVGYVDVTGNDQNAEQIILGPSKWRYRDYVIRSFNEGKPWDRFLTEQLAGDELFDWRHSEAFTEEQRQLLIATGYLRTAIDDTHEVDLNKVPFRYQVVYDTVQIVGSSLFGLTLQCARCHDHKFDPIPQAEYFSLMALFTPALNPYAWLQPKDRELPDVSAKEQVAIQKQNAEVEQSLKPVVDQIHSLQLQATNSLLSSRLAALAPEIRSSVETAFRQAPDKRNEQQKQLLKEQEPKLKWKQADVLEILSADQRAELARLQSEEKQLNARKQKWDAIRGFFESGPPPRNYILQRGDHERRGHRVKPGFLSVLHPTDKSPLLVASGKADEQSTGRRLAFARWLTDPEGRPAALHARVIVNRFWQQLFGEGLVPTPESFGRSGLPPTHPELLEYLASRFIHSSWKVKPLLKELMLSRAYRQSSSTRPGSTSSLGESLAKDPGNRLLWQQRLRRLESEIIRDSILAVSGKLDPAQFGPAVPIINLPDGTAALPSDDKLPTPTSKWRRTLYLMGRRNFHLPILGSFDQPILNTACSRRLSSSVVLQPLTMLNDSFVLQQAQFLADRASRGSPSSENRIDLAFRLALTRSPTAEELRWIDRFLSDQETQLQNEKTLPEEAKRRAFVALCHMLMNTSEFLYLN